MFSITRSFHFCSLIFVMLFPLISAVVNFILSKDNRRAEDRHKKQQRTSEYTADAHHKKQIKAPRFLRGGRAENQSHLRKKPETIRINTPIFPDNRQTLTTSFSSEHFGIVSIALDKIVLYDFLRLSRFRVSKSSIVYDKDGDRMSRVHWKLTAKQDKLMVKDYSLPLCDGCLLLTDTYTDRSNSKGASLYDTVIETAVSLSTLMLNENMRHRIAFFNESTAELCELPVYSDEDFFPASSSAARFGSMLKERYCRAGTRCATRWVCASVMYCLYAPRSAGGTLSALTASGLANRYTVLLCVDPDSPPRRQDDGIQRHILPVPPAMLLLHQRMALREDGTTVDNGTVMTQGGTTQIHGSDCADRDFPIAFGTSTTILL